MGQQQIFNNITTGTQHEFDDAAAVMLGSGENLDGALRYFNPLARQALSKAMATLWQTGKPEDRTAEALLEIFSGDQAGQFVGHGAGAESVRAMIVQALA